MSRIFASILILVFFNVTEVQSRESPPDSLSTESIQLSKTLKNGMQVIVQTMPNATLVRVGVFYAAGSAVEPDSLAGLAHLSEHLLTESSLNFPDGELFRRQNLYSTYSNAYTSTIFMQFDTECLPDFLPEILELEADRLRGVTTDSTSFAREKGVVLEELAMRKRLPPSEEFLQSVFQACFSGHPYGRSPGGTAATVEKIEISDFMVFQERNIRPERSAIVVKGPLDPEKTMAEIERVFGFGPRRTPEYPESAAYPPIASDQIITDSHDHTGMKVCLTFRVPLENDMDAAFVSVLPGLMTQSSLYPSTEGVPGETLISLLYMNEYWRPPTNPEEHWGYVYEDFDPEQQSLGLMAFIWEEIFAMVRETEDPAVFGKRLGIAIEEMGFYGRNPDSSSGLGSTLVNNLSLLTRDRVRGILKDAGPDDFSRFMGRWINPNVVVVGVSHGRDSERSATIRMTSTSGAHAYMGAEAALENLTQAEIEPVLQAYGEAGLIKLDRFQLDNGIPVFNLMIPDSDNWSLAGYRTFQGIKDMRPGKKPGLTQIFNRVVNYDDQKKGEPRELPHDLEFSLNWNSTRFFTQGPADEMDDIIVTVDNRISSREFNRNRWYSLTHRGENYLREIRDKKSNIARAWRWEQILGPKHPSLGKWAPDPDSFKKIKYKDFSRLHKEYVQKTGDLVLFVAGEEPEGQVKPLLNRTFGQYDSWHSRESAELPESNVQGIRGKIIPDLTRGDVMLEFSFPVCHPEKGPRPTTTVLTLEQALRQILTDRLRGQEGLTYWVSSRMFAAQGNQLWEVSVTCRPGQSQIVFSIVREELAGISETGFSDDDIARARLELAGQAIRDLGDQDSGLSHLGRLAEIGEIPSKPIQEINAMTAAEVNTLARLAINPQNFAFTATGPLFEEDIDKFDLQ